MKLSRIALATAAAFSLWLGSDTAQAAVQAGLESAAQLELRGPDAVQAEIKAAGGSGFDLPPMWHVEGSVGILEINGALITGSSGWMRMFGVIGYDDIRQAADELVSQKNVKSIMLHVNSPGGMAAGCEDCASHLKALSAVKPMMTYSDTMMASGGYWLGSVGKPIMAGSTAVLGSIGVIITHVSVQRANEAAGRDVTIIRIGSEKQLANPNEKLTDKAKAHLEAMGEQLYSVFRSNVATNLGVDESKFDKTMGQGREFMGQQAVDAGLASQVATFNQALAYAKSIDTSSSAVQNPRHPKGTSNMKVALSALYIAQLVSGAVAPTALDFTSAKATLSGETPDAEGQVLLKAQAVSLQADIDAAVKTRLDAATAPLATELNTLKATHATVNTELAGLRTSSQALTEKVQSLETSVAAADSVVHASLSAMCVALSLAAPKAVTELKGTDLLAEHERVAGEYAKKFPGARVSAAPSGEKTEPTAQVSSDVPVWARIAKTATAARNGA